MFGNKKNNQGNGQHRNQGVAGTCVCSKCGYSIPHSKGIPCSSMTCPNCKIGLVRQDMLATNKVTITEGLLNQENRCSTPATIIYPKVDTELCTGCGVCIDICPNEAIILKDDKAFIMDDLCKNCKKCVRICPSEAIK